MATERGRQRGRPGAGSQRGQRVVERLFVLTQEPHGPGLSPSTQKAPVPGARPRSAGSSRIASVAARVAEMKSPQRRRVGCCVDCERASKPGGYCSQLRTLCIPRASACNLTPYWTAPNLLSGLHRPSVRRSKRFAASPQCDQIWVPLSGAPLTTLTMAARLSRQGG